MAHAVFKVRGKEIASLNLTGPTMIGRSPDCRVCIQDTALSRRHFRLEPIDANSWCVIDQSSANGTFVDGQRIDRQTLTDGDLIDAGSVTVVFFEDSLPAGGTADSQVPYVITQAALHVDAAQHAPLPAFEHSGDTAIHAPPASKPAVKPKLKWDDVKLVEHGRRHHSDDEAATSPGTSQMPKGVAITAAALAGIACFLAAFYLASFLMQ